MIAKKIIAAFIGGPIIFIGLLILSPLIVIFLVLETIKWGDAECCGKLQMGK